MKSQDITDCIEAYAAVYDDGEVAGVYASKRYAERTHMGEECQIIRLVPAEPVIISVPEQPGR